MTESTITVNRGELEKALAFASLGLPRRPACAVLAGMRVSISCGTLELAAFDYEITARAKVSGDASGPGSILITGAELIAAVKSLPKGKAVTAQVLITDEELVVTCEGIVSRIGAFEAKAASEYPTLPDMPESAGLVDAATFADSVARVVPCASTDDTLPILMCVYLAGERGRLELVTTDRYRLARHRIHWTGEDGEATLIPAAALRDFAKRCARDGKVEIFLSESQAAFSDGERTLITRTGNGHDGVQVFRRGNDFIKPEADTWVTAEAGALAAAVTRAARLTERGLPIHVYVNTGDDGARVTVEVHADGKVVSSQSVPCRYEGPDVHAGFNAGYLASVLNGVGAGRARLGFSLTEGKVTKPVQVRGTDGYAAVQMPIRIDA